MIHGRDFTVWLLDVDKDDERYVGKKFAMLGEMARAQLPVPNGFILPLHTFRRFIAETGINIKIKHLLATLNFSDSNSLSQVTLLIKRLITTTQIPPDIATELFRSYELLGKNPVVNLRASEVISNSKHVAFAGRSCTILNINGEAALAEKIRELWASVYNPEAVMFRHSQKADHASSGISILVQEMVDADAAGTIYTVDPFKEDRSRMIIESVWGNVECMTCGKVIPDYYEVDKKTLGVIYKRICEQEVMFAKKDKDNKEIKVPAALRARQKISDREIEILAGLGKEVERLCYFPQEIEWHKEENKLYLIQTRPITTFGKKESRQKEDTTVKNSLRDSARCLHPLLVGEAVSPGIGIGHVKIIHSMDELSKVKHGDILVVPFTTPDYIQAMKKVAGIITEQGERISHAALVSQELGIPAVVGTITATKTLKTGDVVTVNGTTGEVFKGSFLSKDKCLAVSPSYAIRTATRLYVNLAEPELAEQIAQKNIDGVGLLRGEYLAAQFGVHPKKFIADGKEKDFITKISRGLEIICQAFYPRPVIYRATDFKSNEYRGLKGGRYFEPKEENPMLGLRGATRYIRDPRIFRLELEAIKYVRQEKKLHNLSIMLPFVRTPHELIAVKKIMNDSGFRRSPSLKLFMMIEIPSNVIQLNDFIDAGIDGVSIGSNDLTMLMLGIDRDNSEVAMDFDERNKALLWAYESIIKTCRKRKIITSFCGHASSVYPDLVSQLVSWGINSISVNPDAIDNIRTSIYTAEEKSRLADAAHS